MYVKTETEQVVKFPYRLKDLKAEGVSFRKKPSDEALVRHGICPVIELERPDYDEETQKLERWTLPEKNGDQWEIGYDVIDLTEEEREELLIKRRRGMVTDKAEFMIALSEYDQDGESLLSKIQAALDKAGNPRQVKRLRLRFQHTAKVRRMSPLVITLINRLSFITDEIMDEVFEHVQNLMD